MQTAKTVLKVYICVYREIHCPGLVVSPWKHTTYVILYVVFGITGIGRSIW